MQREGDCHNEFLVPQVNSGFILGCSRRERKACCDSLDLVIASASLGAAELYC
jgi:hypothetical protein